MKSCPVCKATTFDDMEICFGCLHRFDEKDDASVPFGCDRPSQKPVPHNAAVELPIEPSLPGGPPKTAPVSYRLEITLVPVPAR